MEKKITKNNKSVNLKKKKKMIVDPTPSALGGRGERSRGPSLPPVALYSPRPPLTHRHISPRFLLPRSLRRPDAHPDSPRPDRVRVLLRDAVAGRLRCSCTDPGPRCLSAAVKVQFSCSKCSQVGAAAPETQLPLDDAPNVIYPQCGAFSSILRCFIHIRNDR